MRQYKNQYGTIFAVRQLPSGEYRIMCRFGQGEWTKATDPKLSAPCNCAESLQEVLDAEAQRKGWSVYGPADPCKECRCKTCADESCLQAHCDGSDHGMGCIREDGCYAPSEAEPENATEETPAPAPLAPESAAGAPALPRFDYSGLDEATVNDLHLAAREVACGKKLAEIGLRRMADGVAIAHDALCGSCDKMSQLKRGACDKMSQAHNNQHSENTFGAWCESVGLNRKAAERLLNVARLFDASSPRQQQVLEELGPALLYAAAKPSAPAELVQAVKDGDITSNKQYQDLLARYNAEKAAREKAEQERDEAATHIQAARDMQIDTARERDAALQRATAAENRAAGAQKLADQRGDENTSLKAQIRELESRPVEVAVAQPGADQIETWRKEGETRAAAALQDTVRKANQAKADAQRQVADLQNQLAAARPDADACQRTVDTLYETAENLRLLLRTQLQQAQLPPATYGNVVAHVLQTADALRDTVRSCAPAGYDFDNEEDDDFE